MRELVKEPVCVPGQKGIRCMDEREAAAWWAAPYLRADRDVEYVADQADGHFRPGDATKYWSTLGIVLTFGRGGPREKSQNALREGGAIIVREVRSSADAFPHSTDAQQVTVRGNVAWVGRGSSLSTGRTYRTLVWETHDRFGLVKWMSVDDPAQRSLAEVIAILDALQEAG